MNKKTWTQIILGAVAAGIVVVFAIFLLAPMFNTADSSFGNGNSTGNESADASDTASDDTSSESDELTEQERQELREALLAITRNDPADLRAMGNLDAPVTMTVFSDYLCPYCTMFSKETLPKIVKEYVDTGLLRIEWVDAAFQGDASIMAAVASHAAAEQGLYWEYHDALVDLSDSEGHTAFTKEALIAIAEEIGVADVDAFTAYVEDEDNLAMVAADRQLTGFLGINSTPAFVIGGEGFLGAQPFSIFQRVIDSELAEANN